MYLPQFLTLGNPCALLLLHRISIGNFLGCISSSLMKCNCVEESADLSTREFVISQPIMNIQGRSYKSIFKVNATGFRNVISAEYCFTKGDDNLYNVCKEAITDFDDDFVGQLTAFGPFAIQYANSREETLQNSLVFIQSFVKGRKEPETLQSFAQISVVRRICSS